MAKKKEKKEDAYDYTEDLKSLEITSYLRAGFEYFLRDENVKDKNDLEKLLEKFLNKNAGV